MNEIPPEVWQSIAQMGGAPLLMLVGFKWIWNGTSQRITKLEENVQEIRDSVTYLKARAEAQDAA